jgi:hypothetical protein
MWPPVLVLPPPAHACISAELDSGTWPSMALASTLAVGQARRGDDALERLCFRSPLARARPASADRLAERGVGAAVSALVSPPFARQRDTRRNEGGSDAPRTDARKHELSRDRPRQRDRYVDLPRLGDDHRRAIPGGRRCIDDGRGGRRDELGDELARRRDERREGHIAEERADGRRVLLGGEGRRRVRRALCLSLPVRLAQPSGGRRRATRSRQQHGGGGRLFRLAESLSLSRARNVRRPWLKSLLRTLQ